MRSTLNRSHAFESLERRQLLSTTPVLTSQGVLQFTTGDTPDAISLSYKKRNLLVSINGLVSTYVARSVSRIEIIAGAGNDVVDLSTIAIPTYVLGGVGNDFIFGGTGNDSLTGAAGKDTLLGNAGIDRLNGAGSNDNIDAGEGNDVVYGGVGNDVIFAGQGADRVFGEDGNDFINGGSNNDRLYGGNGNDTLEGGRANDLLDGGAGSDSLTGSQGDDRLFARDGNPDTLDGSAGNNWAQTDPTGDTVTSIDTLDAPTVLPPNPQPDPDPVPDPVPDPDPNPNPNPIPQQLAVSFNDESLWDENFDTAVREAKNLGIKAVRVWLNVNTYDSRPRAWDVIDEADVIRGWKGQLNVPGSPEIGGLAMKRIFDLKDAGFTVLATVNEYRGDRPTSTQQVKDLFTYLMNATESQTSSRTLKQAVEYWEVGNEVDLPYYWYPDRPDKPTALKAFVDEVLIPAAEALRVGPASTREKVLSPGVSWSPNDMKAILAQLQVRGALGSIDYAGYHPYGAESAIGQRVDAAIANAKAFGKQIIITEWNVRGFDINGTQNAAWAAAVDRVHRNVMSKVPLSFYFALTNNFPTRGGTITARPAGLLVHDFPASISSSSTIAEQLAYYRSPLQPSQPFYATFNAWA